ncbi:MAG: hypothetical protein A3J84_07595 [Ignavibacteria bacterium RIFOXYA2_FULL_37_17]|nr:MAG: hypothetical protein A3J84_07595 [Ignavibacteria bacterium RIFOXYA2_FULL_37_17]
MILGIIGTFGIFIFIFFFSALSTGVSVFNASSMQANRDALIADGTNITSLAQQYYRKPLKIGGGGNSFKGFEIPESLVKTENGSYHIIINNSKSLTITCVGKELGKDGRNFVRVVFVISPHRIVSTDIRN